ELLEALRRVICKAAAVRVDDAACHGAEITEQVVDLTTAGRGCEGQCPRLLRDVTRFEREGANLPADTPVEVGVVHPIESGERRLVSMLGCREQLTIIEKVTCRHADGSKGSWFRRRISRRSVAVAGPHADPMDLV